MEFDAFQNWLQVERERRKTDREREIDKEIAAIYERHRHEIIAECDSLFKELTRIESAKGPLPIWSEGKVFQYVGPT